MTIVSAMTKPLFFPLTRPMASEKCFYHWWILLMDTQNDCLQEERRTGTPESARAMGGRTSPHAFVGRRGWVAAPILRQAI
jgi:hypothetical protein